MYVTPSVSFLAHIVCRFIQYHSKLCHYLYNDCTLCNFRSIPVEPPHPQVEDYEEEEGSSEGEEEGVPTELLERASHSSSSVGYSRSEEEEEFALQEGTWDSQAHVQVYLLY